MNDDNETDLSLQLRELGKTPLPPPAALVGRVLSDAAMVQDGFQNRWWPQLRGLLGGWSGLGGLAAACAAGVWIGYSPPAFLPDPVRVVQSQTSEYDLLDAGGLIAALSEED